MNTKILSVALALAASASFAAAASAGTITTLDTVQARPSVEQVAQQAFERTSAIPTLDAVQVRPSAQQDAERFASQRIVTLAAVQVRPSVEQQSEARRTATATSVAMSAAAAMTTLLGEVIIHLPMPQLQPSPADLEALIGGFAKVRL